MRSGPAGKKCFVNGAEALGPRCPRTIPSVTLGQLWSGAGLTRNHLFFMAGFCEVVWPEMSLGFKSWEDY